MATRPDNWEAVKALFEAALEKDPACRPSFLKERCADAGLRAEVERLLAEHPGPHRFSPHQRLAASRVRQRLRPQDFPTVRFWRDDSALSTS